MRGFSILIISITGVLSSCLKDNAVVDQAGPQYIKDTTEIAAYIRQKNIAATKLQQGIWFIVDSAGTGIRATFNDSIKIKYTRRLLIDNSMVEQVTTPKHFVVDSLLSGVQGALPQFPVGSKGRIFIPSFYTTGLGVLNSTSSQIFQFQLIDVKDYQLKLDTAAINTYLSTKSIVSSKDKSGLRYSADTLGTGDFPLLNDEVKVSYVAKNLSDGAIIDQEASISFHLSSLILGWQIGLQKMKEGSTFTFYLPSSLCYGPNGNGSGIKSNTNLIFNVKLLKVIHH